MDSLFKQFLNQRETRTKMRPSYDDLLKYSPGPVITIAREYGCKGSTIGIMLVEAINRKNQELKKSSKWRFISNEVIDKAAEDLNMSPELLSEISFKVRSDVASDLTQMFAQGDYASNTKIKNAIARHIYTFAEQGHAVIIGRAAEAITKDIKRSIHVKLVAPLTIRAMAISDKENISLENARKRCDEEDTKRMAFRRYFEADRNDSEYYDLTYNVARMTPEEIVESIMIIGESRGFF